MGFFTDLIKKVSNTQIPKTLEESTKRLTEQSKTLSPVYKPDILESLKKVEQSSQMSSTPIGLAKDVFVEAPARALSSIIQTTNPVAKTKEYTPKTTFEKLVLGEEPIKDIGTKTQEVQQFIKEKVPALSGVSKPLSFLGVIGMTALDLTPIGGEKNALKTIVKVSKFDDAVKIAKEIGVAEDKINDFAKSAVAIKTESEAKSLLDGIKTSTKNVSKLKKYPTIHEGGKIKMVEGEPVNIIDGVETFLHKGDNGWIVSEASTGRYLADSRTAEGAIAKAKFLIDDEEVFKKSIEKYKLPIPETKKINQKVLPPVKQITPENTINKLIKAIDEAVPLREEQKLLYQQERAKRTARVAQAGKIGGEQGFFAQLGQLKGELPKKSFEEIRKQFSQQEADMLFDTIEKSKTLLPLEKVGTKQGLSKLFQGIVPTPGEINNLKEVFPKELIDALLSRRSTFQKITEVGGNILNIPRTAMASVDLSAPLRQGIFMIGRPKQFLSSFKDMFKYAVSEKSYQGLIESIKSRPTYLKMKQGGLSLTDIGGQLSKSEEAFMGNLIEKVPIFGNLVRGSNRAYTGFLNKLRADVFDDILSKAKISGAKVDNDLLKSLGDFINAGTGRGKFGLKETGILPKGLEKIAPVMNATFFSPRLMASRLNLLNPYFYYQLNPVVRKEALKTLFADAGIFASIYGLWKLNGGEVGIDPKSADFGKLKVGNTRYDILGGFQQYIKLASQLITGEIVSTTTGRTITLGEGYKPLTRQEIITRFFESKTSPIASFIIGLLKQQTATGEDFDIPSEVIGRFIPMLIQDMYDISQEKGSEGLLYGLPAIFGVGTQTYGKQELVKGKSIIGEETTQIRPIPELAEKIRELIMGQLPIGTSKSFSVEAYYDQLSNLPKNEAADIFDKIKDENPELAKKLYDVVKEREKGITVKDKDLKAKGVASGDRALAIKKEFDKLKTKEEKAKLWEDYVKKGIITKDVSKQLIKLLNQK